MKQLKLSAKCNHDTLINFGFKKYGTNYKMFIPLYQKNGETLIELEILILLVDQYIGYDVLDVCNKNLYTAFYDSNNRTVNNVVLKTVIHNLDEIFSDMKESNILDINQSI